MHQSYFIDPELVVMKQTQETEDMRSSQASPCEKPPSLVHRVSQTK